MEDLQAFNSEEVARAVFSSVIPVVVGVGHERDETLADYAADVRASTPTNAAERVVPDRREVGAFLDGAVRGMDAAMRAALSGRAHRVESMAGRIEAHARHRIDEFRHLLRDFASRFDHFSSGVREKVAACESFARLLKTLDPRRPLEKGYALVWGPDGIVKDAAAVDAGTMLELQLRRGRLGAKVTEKKT